MPFTVPQNSIKVAGADRLIANLLFGITMFGGLVLKSIFPTRRNVHTLGIFGSGVLTAAAMVCYSKSAAVMASTTESWKNANSIYDFSYVDIDGKPRSMQDYKNHVLVVVNLASKCTLTNVNYQQLTELHEKYGVSQGLRIIGFPCNQFGNQEPGSEPEIKKFISQFNVKFDMSSKIEVNGDGAHPLWKYLKSKQGGILGDQIKWNFTKFLIDKKGNVVQRFSPTSQPKELEPDIQRLLKE